MQNHLYMSEHDLKVTVINNRSTHFQKNNVFFSNLALKARPLRQSIREEGHRARRSG